MDVQSPLIGDPARCGVLLASACRSVHGLVHWSPCGGHSLCTGVAGMVIDVQVVLMLAVLGRRGRSRRSWSRRTAIHHWNGYYVSDNGAAHRNKARCPHQPTPYTILSKIRPLGVTLMRSIQRLAHSKHTGPAYKRSMGVRVGIDWHAVAAVQWVGKIPAELTPPQGPTDLPQHSAPPPPPLHRLRVLTWFTLNV